MIAAIDLPAGDSLDLSFAFQDPEGNPLPFDAATLTVNASPAYTLAGASTGIGMASFAIPAGALMVPGAYSAAIAARTGTTEQGTLAFTLRVVGHA